MSQSDSLSSTQIALFTSRLACMLSSGMPLIRAMEVEAGSAEGSAPIAEALALQTQRGNSFSNSLTLFPEVFSPTYITLVRVGEETGGLVHALVALADHLNRTGRFANRLRSALAYPLCVTTAVMAMLSFLLFYMVPRFAEMYAGSGAKLPAPTALVVALSRPQMWLPVAVVAALIGLRLLSLYRSPEGRRWLVNSFYTLPGVGHVAGLSTLARTTACLGLMLHQGLTLSRSLKVVRTPTTGWNRLDDALKNTESRLGECESLAQAFSEEDLFPGLMVQMVQTGEETGRLSEFFRCYSQMLDDDVEIHCETFLQVFEPALMGFSGLLVAFIVLSAFLPIYQLLNL